MRSVTDGVPPTAYLGIPQREAARSFLIVDRYTSRSRMAPVPERVDQVTKTEWTMMMQERIDPRHAAPPTLATDAALRVADIATAAAMILLFLPMIGLVTAVSGRAGAGDAGVRRALHRFRADQLPQLFGVMRGEYSFYRTSDRPRAFSD